MASNDRDHYISFKPRTSAPIQRPSFSGHGPAPISSHVEVPHATGHYGYGKYDPEELEVVYSQTTEPKDIDNVPDYMSVALFSSIFCFWPLGIVAVLRSKKARRLKLAGDIPGARKLASSAKLFLICSIVCGILVFGIAIGVGVGVMVDVRHKYFG